MKTPGNAVRIEQGEKWAYDRGIIAPTWEFMEYQNAGRKYWDLCFSFGQSAFSYEVLMLRGYKLSMAQLSIWTGCRGRIIPELFKWFNADWEPLYGNWGADNITIAMQSGPLGLPGVKFAMPVSFRITLVRD